MQALAVLVAVISLQFSAIEASSLISSSELQLCRRTGAANFDPFTADGRETCQKKFVVALSVRNGQGNTGSIYADIEYVTNRTVQRVERKEQLKKPFRVTATKSDVHINYPLRYIETVNNHPSDLSYLIENVVLGVPGCSSQIHCFDLGFCCSATTDEKLSRAWEYKRALNYQVWHYHSHKYSQSVCMTLDALNYHVFEVNRPYLSYRVNVTVQELQYITRNLSTNQLNEVWKTVGYAVIGPQTIGQNTNQNQVGETSGPNVKAVWLGSFQTTTAIANFDSKYILVPDWRGSLNPSETLNHEQVTGGPSEWLIVDKHLVDVTGRTCNKIGVSTIGFKGQPGRCIQEINSCFRLTARALWLGAKIAKDKGLDTDLFPDFYGDFVGPYGSESTDDVKNINPNFKLVYKSQDTHKSLITLTMEANSISFVENRSSGRIVEAIINEFTSLIGSGALTVTVQNTGTVTSDYSVSIDECSEGIIRVSEKTKVIQPRQLVDFEFTISTSLNLAFNHSCYIELTDRDGVLLDRKQINFTTEESCIYCPASACSCGCELEELNDTENEKCQDLDYLNPFWVPEIIYIPPCYHCWFTNSFVHPVFGPFTILIILMSMGMIKMLIAHCCCKTKDGRPIDVVGIILGTADSSHTKRKQKSSTFYFLLGACFFVYLPFLPFLIILCNWRRRIQARRRLKKKADRKRKRLLQRKRAALAATRGLMVLGHNIAVKDAIDEIKKDDVEEPMILVVSSSSDTDEKDFNYSSSTDTDVYEEVFGEDIDTEIKKTGKKQRKK